MFDGLPNSRDLTRLLNKALQVAVVLRLGFPVAAQGVCACDSVLDLKENYTVTFGCEVSCGVRHSSINQKIKNAIFRSRRRVCTRDTWPGARLRKET